MIEPPQSDAQSEYRQKWTVWLLCAVATLDGADFQLLPASFRALEADLGIPIARLAMLSMAQGVAYSVAAPFWGNLADNGISRRLLILCGMLAWGVFTIILSGISHFGGMLTLRILNGCALGLITPIAQSLVADVSPRAERGKNFGIIEFGNRTIGQVVGIVFVTSLSNRQVWGMAGWRVAYFCVGAVSLLLTPIIFYFLTEVPRAYKPDKISLLHEFKSFWGYLSIRSFQAILVQGLFGTIPWSAMSFGTMYLQYAGLEDSMAAAAFSMYALAGGFGCILGGKIGDFLSVRFPDYGRPMTAMISVMLGIPIVVALFHVLPPSASMTPWYFILLLALGLLSSWCATGCNKPVFLDIVPAEKQASVMSWEKCLESTSGQLIGPPIVSLLAVSVFGYRTSTQQVSQMDSVTRLMNARALGQALVYMTIFPWVLCFFAYTRLLFTYSGDIVEDHEKLGLVGNDHKFTYTQQVQPEITPQAGDQTDSARRKDQSNGVP